MALTRVLHTTAISIALVVGGASLSAASAQKSVQVVDELHPDAAIPDMAVDTAKWVVASGDSLGLPFAVIDKKTAQILVFDGTGKVRGAAPVLIGSAEGDDSAPGVGDRELQDIPMKDRTTPAGRFIAAYGRAAGDQRVLWVDYDTAISLHPLPARETKEQRGKRLTSADPKDNRITHGCINVSPEFYSTVVQPLFAEGGMFYVLPDKRALPDAFPTFKRRTASPSEGNAVAISFMGE